MSSLSSTSSRASSSSQPSSSHHPPPHDQSDAELLDCVQVTPAHLRANGSVHLQPYSGLAEIIDNAMDSGAGHIYLNYCDTRNDVDSAVKDCFKRDLQPFISITDDGVGMSRVDALNAIWIGHSHKKGTNDTIGQFGNGLKSGALRLGETLLVTTKKNGQYTILLISLNYLEAINSRKCLVPLISYSFDGDQWDRLLLRDEKHSKHDAALKVILEYTPFKSEPSLKRYLLQTIPGESGTSVLVTDLRRLSNLDTELIVWDGDICKAVMDNDRDKAMMNPRELYFADYVAELYLKPKAAIYFRGRRINVRHPIKRLADPAYMRLDSKTVKRLKEMEQVTIDADLVRIGALQEQKKGEIKKITNEMAKLNGNAVQLKAMRKEQQMLNDELKEIEKTLQSITERMNTNEEIKVYFGIDVLNRGQPHVVFYTNGRRITSMPFNQKKFHKHMGVVAIVDLPASMLPTSQNRENYATPSETAFLKEKIEKMAQNYFEFANPRFKSDEFWLQFKYDAGGSPYENCSQVNAPSECVQKALVLTGHWRQCAECKQFKKVRARDLDQSPHAPSVIQEYALPYDTVTFTCSDRSVIEFPGTVKANVTDVCPTKGHAELKADDIPLFKPVGIPTYWGAKAPVDKGGNVVIISANGKITKAPPQKQSVPRPREADMPFKELIETASRRSAPAAQEKLKGKSRAEPDEEAASSESSTSPPPRARKSMVGSKPATDASHSSTRRHSSPVHKSAAVKAKEAQKAVVAKSSPSKASTSSTGRRDVVDAVKAGRKRTHVNYEEESDDGEPALPPAPKEPTRARAQPRDPANGQQALTNAAGLRLKTPKREPVSRPPSAEPAVPAAAPAPALDLSKINLKEGLSDAMIEFESEVTRHTSEEVSTKYKEAIRASINNAQGQSQTELGREAGVTKYQLNQLSFAVKKMAVIMRGQSDKQKLEFVDNLMKLQDSRSTIVDDYLTILTAAERESKKKRNGEASTSGTQQ